MQIGYFKNQYDRFPFYLASQLFLTILQFYYFCTNSSLVILIILYSGITVDYLEIKLNRATTRENGSSDFLTRSDKNGPAQSQQQARNLKRLI